MAAIAEQHNDEHGLIWPKSVAPFQVALVIVSMKDEAQKKAAAELYEQLSAAGFEVLLDDRDERPGVKFKDMDLVGIPCRITLGRKLGEGLVEFKMRDEAESFDVELSKVIDEVKNRF